MEDGVLEACSRLVGFESKMYGDLEALYRRSNRKGWRWGVLETSEECSDSEVWKHGGMLDVSTSR